MALYLIGNYLVRSRNGRAAKELTGIDAEPMRITEAGEDGVISLIEIPAVAAEAPAVEDDDPTDDEVDVTSLSDKGKRLYQNKRTGKTRSVKRND